MGIFGEIVEPVSRNSWEDWDEISTESDADILHWKLPLKVPDCIDVLFLLEGRVLSDCVKGQPKNYLSILNCIPEANAYLYQLKSSNQYILTVKDYNILQSSEIVELLKPFIINSGDVVTIQTKPLAEFQTANPSIHPWVVRKINTTTPLNKFQNLDFNNANKLEQPNILSGISAGAVCLREHLKLSAIAFVYYIEHTEEFQTNAIQQLLEELKIIKIRNTKYSSIMTSNLYI